MKPRRIWSLFLIWLTLSAGSVVLGDDATDGKLTVSIVGVELEKPATVGDPVAFKVTLLYPEGSEPPILVRKFPSDVVFVKEDPLEKSTDGQFQQETRLLHLAFFQTGECETGPIGYTAVGPNKTPIEATAPGMKVTVTSVLKGEEETAAPPEPPWVIPYPLEKLITLIAIVVLVLLALVGLWIVIRRRRRKTGIDKPRIPPHLEAKQRLYDLTSQDLPVTGHVRLFYFLASEIIKDYLGKELGVVVLERTTTEIIYQLPRLGYLSSGVLDEVDDFLVSADQVKFAKYFPTTSELDRWQRKAYELVNEVHEESIKHRHAGMESSDDFVTEEAAS